MQGKRLLRYVSCCIAAVMTTAFAATAPITAPVTSPAPVVNTTTSPVNNNPVSSSTSITPNSSNNNAQVWNLKNADIRAVIQTISVITGKNFIVDPRVHGTVTLVSQKPMTPSELYQVFLSMLQILQYVAIPSGNVIKIVPAMDGNSLSRQVASDKAPGTGDEIVVRVVPVTHVSATQLVPVLRPLMSQAGSVTAYLPSNSLILAGTASNIKRLVEVVRQMDDSNETQISVVHLHYANAGKIAEIIKQLQAGAAAQGASSNATIAADEEDNSILINANLANQLLMKQLIAQLDQPGAGGDDTRVVRLNYLSAKKLAPILTKVARGMSVSAAKAAGKTATQAGSGSSGGNISVQPEIASNSIIIHAPKAMMSGLLRVIHRLDVKPREVLVEAIIVKVDENLLNKLGIVWGTSDGAVVAAGSTNLASANIGSDNTFAMNANHNFGFLPDGNLIAILHALKQNTHSEILATPSVVVLDNEKASIDDGENLGVANRSYQGASATTTGDPTQNIVTPFNTIQRQDVTLSLQVTPHISPNSMIRMSLLQKDDSVAALASLATQPDNPVFNTSKIKTSVLVKSGDVLVLGGLMNNEQQKTVEKLPVLGDLPIVGHLFRYDTHKIDKTSLMIFIRPVILSKKTANAQTMNRYKYIRSAQIGAETEAVKEAAAMPILPPLTPDHVMLPKPVSPQPQLPMPTTTGAQ